MIDYSDLPLNSLPRLHLKVLPSHQSNHSQRGEGIYLSDLYCYYLICCRSQNGTRKRSSKTIEKIEEEEEEEEEKEEEMPLPLVK